MLTSPLFVYFVSGSIVSSDLLPHQLQPPPRMHFNQLAVPWHRVVLDAAPHADHIAVVAAAWVPRLTRRQHGLAAVEVGQVDDLPPARREAVDVVSMVGSVCRLPYRVRVAADRHRPAVEHAAQPGQLAQWVPESLL